MTSFMGQASQAKNDITRGQANCTGMPPDRKSKQSLVTNQSLFKHWLQKNLGAYAYSEFS